MKNITRKILLFHLLALYVFVIWTYSSYVVISNTTLLPLRTAEKGHYFSAASNNLFCHTSQSENFINGFDNLPSYSLKNNLEDCSQHMPETYLNTQNVLSIYFYHPEKIVIKFEPTDIVFPFHFFS